MQELTDGNELPAARHIPALQALARERTEAQKDVTPVTHEAAYRADVERLEQAAEIFLNVEERQQNAQPVGFEVSFGFGQSGPLDSAEPVAVRLTEEVALRLRGRIDRVDRVEDGYAIWDYKSGSAHGYGASELSRAGSYLQWALYAYVLDEILARKGEPDRVVQSGYFFTTARECMASALGRRFWPATSWATCCSPSFSWWPMATFCTSRKRRRATTAPTASSIASAPAKALRRPSGKRSFLKRLHRALPTRR